MIKESPEVKLIGETSIPPRTMFLWVSDYDTMLEVTLLDDGDGYESCTWFLVRCTKGYRLVSQNTEGRENWDRNLRDLNEYLSDTFPSFTLTMDYVNTLEPGVVDFPQSNEEVFNEVRELWIEKEQVLEKINDLSETLEFASPSIEHLLETRLQKQQSRLEDVDHGLDKYSQELYERRELLNQWQENGVMMSYVFEFSTDPELAQDTYLDEVVASHLDDAYNYHRRKVKQVLQGEQFKLRVEELSEPRVFSRLEHSGLLNPQSFSSVLEQVDDPGLEEHLQCMRTESAKQFLPVALTDLVDDQTGEVVHRSKSTPSRAVQSILNGLETHDGKRVGNVPNSGPMLGVLKNGVDVVGFDPAELPHYYISGGTGSGKSYLKRVLVENCVSLGYDVLSISPSDTEDVGVSFPNPDHGDGTGLNADHYWPGNQDFPGVPSDLTELFTGLNVCTLQGLPDSEKQGVVDDVLSRLAGLDRTENPLFVFLEEAHNFNEGSAADSLQKLVRESRKFGVHVVVVSQSPMDFNRNHKHVRENTVNLFLQGEYTDYADQFLRSGDRVTGLGTGEVIVHARDFPELTVSVRSTLSLATSPSEEQLSELVSASQRKDLSSLKNGVTGFTQTPVESDRCELGEDEEELLGFIKNWIQENDERPTHSKCWREGPYGSTKTKRLLGELVEKDVVNERTDDRNGNKAQVYQPS